MWPMADDGRPTDSRRLAVAEAPAEMVSVSAAVLKTPVGNVYVAASATHVVSIDLPRRHAGRPFERWLRERLFRHTSTPVLRAALAQLREYFGGKRRSFDVPLEPSGTSFQRSVWQALVSIPYGDTVSYGSIAAALGTPHLARAVGAAVGANPIPIIIPCHRVIGADGSLTGYGGCLRMKIWLLHHEGVLLA